MQPGALFSPPSPARSALATMTIPLCHEHTKARLWVSAQVVLPAWDALPPELLVTQVSVQMSPPQGSHPSQSSPPVSLELLPILRFYIALIIILFLFFFVACLFMYLFVCISTTFPTLSLECQYQDDRDIFLFTTVFLVPSSISIVGA